MRERMNRWLRAYAEKDGRGYPDWLLRYGPIARRLRPRLTPGARVLEVGANENGLARFAPCRPIAVDLAMDHLRAARRALGVCAAVADITALPFLDASFDVIVCVDTFEHLPPETRLRAACELVRLLKPDGVAVLAFPAGPGALAAERAVRDAYRAYTGGSLHWFEEHAAQGLPEPDALRECLTAAAPDHCATRQGNAPLWLWAWMWRVLMCGWPGRGNTVFQAILRLAAPLLARIQIGAPYRCMLWLEPRKR